MTLQALVTTPEEQRELERFYFHEARLLDARQYTQWLELLDPQVQYTIPSRVNVQVDNRMRGQEAMLDVARELEGDDSPGNPIRVETYVALMLRAERAYKINSWSENPPARTRRIVGNIELMAREGTRCTVWSNFHLYYARPGNAEALYSGQRRDVLETADPGLRIRRRDIILDYANIEYPTLGLFF